VTITGVLRTVVVSLVVWESARRQVAA